MQDYLIDIVPIILLPEVQETQAYTKNAKVVFLWQFCRHWIYGILLLWQPPWAPATTKLASWRLSIIGVEQIFKRLNRWKKFTMSSWPRQGWKCISMVWCKTAVSPLLTHWKYWILALNNRYDVLKYSYVNFVDDLEKTSINMKESPLTLKYYGHGHYMVLTMIWKR